MHPKRGRKSYLTPEGKVALMFLRMYTGLSFPKLMEQLDANVHFQIFCDIIIDPTHPLTNYKVLDDIAAELSTKLRIQQQQDLLAEMWKPYMKELDTMYTDATCYESERRYPTDPKLVWESTEKAYVIMCEMSGRLKEHRPRTKYLDVEKVTRMRGAMPNEDSVLLLMGKTAMDKKSYLRQVPRIDSDTTLFPPERAAPQPEYTPSGCYEPKLRELV